jgi:hypothetical protein
MATIKQMEANRRNALKSTGPRTPEGKAAVRMNSLRHGLRARTVVLPGENHDEFHQLCDDLEVDWQPQSRSEQFYLEQMAVSQWKLTRMEVGEIKVFQQASTANYQTPLLDRLWQAQCRMERSYARAQHELDAPAKRPAATGASSRAQTGGGAPTSRRLPRGRGEAAVFACRIARGPRNPERRPISNPRTGHLGSGMKRLNPGPERNHLSRRLCFPRPCGNFSLWNIALIIDIDLGG